MSGRKKKFKVIWGRKKEKRKKKGRAVDIALWLSMCSACMRS
jgi:hypothetical protein